MKRIYIIFWVVLSVCFSLTTLYAQTDHPVTLGGITTDGQLKIEVFSNGCFDVKRFSGEWKQQFYDMKTTPLFSIKIGTVTYSSSGTNASPGAALTAAKPLTAFNVIEDIGTAVTVGTQQEMTKKFTGTYGGKTFSVTLTITYNTDFPDFFVKDAIIDVTDIPLGTPIIFAYGFDTTLATYDKGYAFIVPDLFGLNNNTTKVESYLTKEQVQSLRLVGARNSVSGNSIIAYYPIGRNFDRAYSAYPYANGYSYNIPALSPTSSSDDTKFKFIFGPYSNPDAPDNAQGVGYDDIPAGEITEIKTGLTFTTSLEGELNYYWNNEKKYSGQIGETVNLNLKYKSYSNNILDDVGFRVDFEGLHIDESGCSSSGFTGETETCVAGNEYYEIIDAEVSALGDATVAVPVKITQAGQWKIDNTGITNIAHTFPLGAPAILTIPTTVSLTDTKPTRIYKGETKTYTVKFPDNVTAAQDVTVNLTYYGDISSFSSLPATVTIPAGENSVSFQVMALQISESNSSLLITLSSVDKAFVSVVAPSSNMLTIEYEAIEIEICQGRSVTLVAHPVNGGDFPTYQWKKNGINIEGATHFKYTYDLAGGDTLYCEMTSNANCTFPITVNSPTIIMLPCTTTWISGTVFPFIHYEEPELAELFPVVANLYDISLLSQGANAILASQPLYTDTARYYDGTEFIPNTPNYPGYLGCLSNPGYPINKAAIGYTGNGRTIIPLLEDEKPETSIGLYKLSNVKQGEYILVLSKGGYVTRFAKINANTENFLLAHRELIPGDANGNFTVDENAILKILSKISEFGDPLYDPFFDLNGDLKIDATDISIMKVYMNFHAKYYEDSELFFPEN